MYAHKEGCGYFTYFTSSPVMRVQIAPYTTCLVNGVFWAPGTSRLLTIEQCKQLLPEHFDACQLRYEGVPKLPQKLLAVADISCDLNVC